MDDAVGSRRLRVYDRNRVEVEPAGGRLHRRIRRARYGSEIADANEACCTQAEIREIEGVAAGGVRIHGRDPVPWGREDGSPSSASAVDGTGARRAWERFPCGPVLADTDLSELGVRPTGITSNPEWVLEDDEVDASAIDDGVRREIEDNFASVAERYITMLGISGIPKPAQSPGVKLTTLVTKRSARSTPPSGAAKPPSTVTLLPSAAGASR
jgi:hypothetical protein